MTVKVHQDEYLQKITEMKFKLADDGVHLDKASTAAYQGKIGELNWLCTQTRVDGAFETSFLSSSCSSPTKTDALMLNRCIRRLKARPLHLFFRKIGNGNLDDVRVVVPQDAGWAVRRSGHSQAGALVLLCGAAVLEGKPSTALTVDWLSAKISRVVRSSYACETHACLDAVDYLERYLALLASFWHGATEQQFRQDGPPADTAVVTDCRSLYTHLHNDASKGSTSSSERRLQIDVTIMKQNLKLCKGVVGEQPAPACRCAQLLRALG